MAIVSISEAARLVGKNRKTIQRYVAEGKLSLSQDVAVGRGIDTSELLRVFEVMSQGSVCDVAETKSQHVAADEMECLRRELAVERAKIEQLKERLVDKDRHIESVEKAMLLLESGINRPESLSRKWWRFWWF
jgi:hypothetical protein